MPAQGLQALEAALCSPAAVSVIGPLSWPSLLKAPGRRQDSLYDEFREQPAVELSQPVAEERRAAATPGKDLNVGRTLEGILAGILGGPVSKEQPLMEVKAVSHPPCGSYFILPLLNLRIAGEA